MIMNLEMLDAIKYIAIDPGKTPGCAVFNIEGIVLNFWQFKDEDELLDWLENPSVNPEVLIVEAFRNRPGVGNEWSKGENTTQQVGAIKRAARKKKIPVIEQEPSPCLAMGLRFIGVYHKYYPRKGKKKHVPNPISAFAHGTYYLRKERIQK